MRKNNAKNAKNNKNKKKTKNPAKRKKNTMTGQWFKLRIKPA